MSYASSGGLLKFSGDAAYYAPSRSIHDFNKTAVAAEPKFAPEPAGPRLLECGDFVDINANPNKDLDLLASLPQLGLVRGAPQPPEGSRLTMEDLKKRGLVGLYVGPNPDDPKKAYDYLVGRLGHMEKMSGKWLKWDGPR